MTTEALVIEAPWTRVFEPAEAEHLGAVLTQYIPARRWFRSKSRRVDRVSIECAEVIPGADARLVVARVAYAEGEAERYVLPLTWLSEGAARAVAEGLRVVELTVGGEAGWLVDGVASPDVLRALLAAIIDDARVHDHDAALTFRAIVPPKAWGAVPGAPRRLDVEQSNTSIAFGSSCMLKLVRRLDEAPGADLEMGEFLTRAGYAHAPPVLGAIELSRTDGEAATVAIVHRFVASDGDAWGYFLGRLARILEGTELLESSLGDVRLLAARVAAMHVALAGGKDPAFVPEPTGREERARLAEATRVSLALTFARLRSSASGPDLEAVTRAVLAKEQEFEAILQRFVATDVPVVKTRIHGDLHLGQVLAAEGDFVLIDFEGEPLRSLAERKGKRSPLADVAGMLRSFHYATTTALRALKAAAPSHHTLAETSHDAMVRAFLDAYFEAVAATSVLPTAPDDRRTLLDFYRLEKCAYEVRYELDNRPDWVAIPLAGLLQIAG